MKIPKLSAAFSVGAATGTYRGSSCAGAPAAVVPMATLSCLSACVGPATAARCAAQCADQGNSAACWQQCSGSSDPGCVQACFQS